MCANSFQELVERVSEQWGYSQQPKIYLTHCDSVSYEIIIVWHGFKKSLFIFAFQNVEFELSHLGEQIKIIKSSDCIGSRHCYRRRWQRQVAVDKINCMHFHLKSRAIIRYGYSHGTMWAFVFFWIVWIYDAIEKKVVKTSTE